MLAPDFATKSAMKNIDTTLTSSYYIQKHLSKPEDQDKDKVIHPFVSTDQIKLEKTSKHTTGGRQKILYVGSHKVLRGEDDFLHMVALLNHNTPTVKARAVTNYPIPGRIKRLVNKLELGETVEFLPREVQLDMQQLMEQSDLYVFTGLPPVGAIDPPLTIIESQILGTPVLSYNAAGICEVLGPENLVRYGDVKALAELARHLLENPTSREPRPDLLQKYGSENAARQFERFYEKLV
jgi:glycosyltransferase involved in cell wall biosynthesis